MDLTLAFLVFLTIAVLCALVFSLSLQPMQQTEPEKKLQGTDFIPTQMFMGSDGLGGLAVNDRLHKICLFKSPSFTPHVIPTTDLIASFLIKNGEIIGEGKRSNPIEFVTFLDERNRQQASIMANLNTGSSQGSTQRIDLLVAIHDHEHPFFVINFLDMETKEGGILFEKSLSTATHWHYVLDGIILETDQIARLQSELTQAQEMVETAP